MIKTVENNIFTSPGSENRVGACLTDTGYNRFFAYTTMLNFIPVITAQMERVASF